MAQSFPRQSAEPVENRLVIVGASAGGLQAFQRVLEQLPARFPVPILFLWHLPAEGDTIHDEILSGVTNLNVQRIEDVVVPQPGHLYTAVPGRDIVVSEEGLKPVRSNSRLCPSIDRAISSAALIYKDRLTAILLTGALDDGVEGLLAVHKFGGLAIVQDPEDSRFPSMPLEAIRRDHPTFILAADEIGKRLIAYA